MGEEVVLTKQTAPPNFTFPKDRRGINDIAMGRNFSTTAVKTDGKVECLAGVRVDCRERVSAKNVDCVIGFSRALESRYYGARLAAQCTTTSSRKIAHRRDRSADVPAHMTRVERNT